MPLRENFIERVFRSPERSEGAHYRWTEMLKNEPTLGGLVKFHTAHKITLMARSPAHYQEMGRLVAKAGAEPWDEMVPACGGLLIEGLRVLETRGKHVNARSVQYLMGYLKNELPAEDTPKAKRSKQELLKSRLHFWLANDILSVRRQSEIGI